MSLLERIRSAYEHSARQLVRVFARSAQRPYLRYCFSAMGRISKSCGRVTEAHIAYAERLMQEFGFGRRDRQAAIGWFGEGKSGTADFHRLANDCNKKPQDALAELVLECLIHTAHIESSAAANRTLKLLTSLLKVDNPTLLHKQALVAQASSAECRAREVLGLAEDASFEAIKRAYRTLASRYHPDKLGRGASEAETAYYQQRSVEIRNAYDTLCARRG